uniref:ATP synthase CFO B chain subunit I n=1 Tax=Asparagopsis taxiformis TaxID=260499 RepID=A0A1C9CC00_9FLOR|nr:ATP synthase CFO B chain subunit I [Asparagopsis taxiformis]AOM65923.1 ATP synthase CFO B chain subunit I [Asparagopsis taxiformis]
MMNNILQIFSIITEYDKKGLSFNTNFLEANVINITLLLLGLIYVLKQFLGSMLKIRQEKVILAVQESEERLKEAHTRLLESEKQLAQTQIIIGEIEQEASITSQKVRESILAQGKIDIERLIATGKVNIETAERQAQKQIQAQITSLALKRVKLQLQSEINIDIQTKILDRNIMQLGGKI